jgi:acid phosphatase type 7
MFKNRLFYFIIVIMTLSVSFCLCAEENQRAIIIGDSRTNIDIYRQITEKIVQHKPIAVFHTGDMVSNGAVKAQWDDFNAATAKIKQTSSFFPAFGNHEASTKIFLEQFPGIGAKSYYSTDQVGLHWIILDSGISLKKGTEQLKWLNQELKHNRDKFCIILLHYPIYSSGPHAHEFNSQTLRDLIEKFKVKLVFSGHDHLYERSFHEGTYYIVSGGAGAPLKKKVFDNPYSQFYSSTYHYCVLDNHPNDIHIDVFDLNDKKIDSLTINK